MLAFSWKYPLNLQVVAGYWCLVRFPFCPFAVCAMEVNKSKSNTKDMAVRPACCCNVSAATVKTFLLHVFSFILFLWNFLACCNVKIVWHHHPAGWLVGWLAASPSSRGAASHPGGTSFAAAIAHSAAVPACRWSTVEQPLSLSIFVSVLGPVCVSACVSVFFFLCSSHLSSFRLSFGPLSWRCKQLFQFLSKGILHSPCLSFYQLCFFTLLSFWFLFLIHSFFFFALLVPILTFCCWLSQPVIPHFACPWQKVIIRLSLNQLRITFYI